MSRPWPRCLTSSRLARHGARWGGWEAWIEFSTAWSEPPTELRHNYIRGLRIIGAPPRPTAD